MEQKKISADQIGSAFDAEMFAELSADMIHSSFKNYREQDHEAVSEHISVVMFDIESVEDQPDKSLVKYKRLFIPRELDVDFWEWVDRSAVAVAENFDIFFCAVWVAFRAFVIEENEKGEQGEERESIIIGGLSHDFNASIGILPIENDEGYVRIDEDNTKFHMVEAERVNDVDMLMWSVRFLHKYVEAAVEKRQLENQDGAPN